MDLNEAFAQYQKDGQLGPLLNQVRSFALAKARHYRVLDTEDAAQDIVLRVGEIFRNFDPSRGNFRSWVYVLTTNYLNSCHRSAKRSRERIEQETNERPLDSILPAPIEMPSRSTKSLPEPMQKITALLVLGYTKDEIADKLGCSVRTVERRIESHLATAA